MSVSGGERQGAVGRVVDHGGMGHVATQQAGTEGRVGLPPGVGAVVRVGRPLVLQAGREAPAGGGELLVQSSQQEALEREDRGDAHGGARHGQQDEEPGGELSPQGAERKPSHGASDLRTYPTPRTVWIIGGRPASIFLRR